MTVRRRGRIPLPRGRAWAAWLRESPAALVALAIAVGVVTGLGAVAFRWLITAFTRMFTGYDDYSALGRVPSLHFPWLGIWFLLLAPVVAGAMYGPIVHKFAPEARGHGVPEVMYAVGHRGGRIAPQVTLVKALASSLCMGGGGSVGREGPIVQIGVRGGFDARAAVAAGHHDACDCSWPAVPPAGSRRRSTLRLPVRSLRWS